MFFLYLASGLFLGWSLGANDAANVFGTAVGTKMIRFGTAATVCSIFVLVGAVFGGAGASHTLGQLGAVNALPGSFTVALAAALTVTWMTRLSLPVSTSQAVVGAIIGWNFFSDSATDFGSLTKIVSSWVLCPVLAAGFAVLIFLFVRRLLRWVSVHMFYLDGYTRIGLFVVGGFASYSLGANNIANVVGVFVASAPFDSLKVFGVLTLDAAQQLFLLGAIAIGVGVFTYSRRVMLTVGNDLLRMSSISALIVVLAQAIVLFLFSSEGLERWLIQHGLPTIPLVPVSSSQAVIGAVIGIGLAKGGRNIRFRVLGRIASGWVSTPIISGVISFIALFFVQNVFSQTVFTPIEYRISEEVTVKLKQQGLYAKALDELLGQDFDNAVALTRALRERVDDAKVEKIITYAEVMPLKVNIALLAGYFDYSWFSKEQLEAVARLNGREFSHAWQLHDALARLAPQWKLRPFNTVNKLYNKQLGDKLTRLQLLFRHD